MQFLKDLTASQWWASSRNYISFVAGILATLGFVTATQQQGLIAGLTDIVGGIERTVAGIVMVAGILAPVINGLIASRRASPVAKIQDVQAMASGTAQPQSTQAKEALVVATNSIKEVAGVITAQTPAGEALAMSVPSNTVAPAGSAQAKQVANA